MVLVVEAIQMPRLGRVGAGMLRFEVGGGELGGSE